MHVLALQDLVRDAISIGTDEELADWARRLRLPAMGGFVYLSGTDDGFLIELKQLWGGHEIDDARLETWRQRTRAPGAPAGGARATYPLRANRPMRPPRGSTSSGRSDAPQGAA